MIIIIPNSILPIILLPETTANENCYYFSTSRESSDENNATVSSR